MRKALTILYSIVCAVLITSCGADQAMKKGDKFFAVGEYFDAAAQYRKAYTHTPNKEREKKGQRAMKMAECYRRILFTSKAISAYQNAIRYKQDDSLTHFYLGQLQMRNGNYREAEKQFQMAADSLPFEDPHRQLALTGLKSAKQAAQWKKDGSAYTIKRMDLFNSRRAEYSPMLGGDEDNQLYFTSTRNQARGDEYSGITGSKNADIFLSQKDDKGKWSKPQTIDSELNSDLDEGACCFSPDGRSMYLTICKTDPNYPRYATIAVSSRSDAAWSKPKELAISKDTLSSFAHPAISPDGEWLYFVSDMPGGLGGFDIWRCKLIGNEVGAAENLGEPVNTPGDEMFPTFRPNGDFYFSSDGHPGMGGLDLFVAKEGKVENLGFPMKPRLFLFEPRRHPRLRPYLQFLQSRDCTDGERLGVRTGRLRTHRCPGLYGRQRRYEHETERPGRRQLHPGDQAQRRLSVPRHLQGIPEPPGTTARGARDEVGGIRVAVPPRQHLRPCAHREHLLRLRQGNTSPGICHSPRRTGTAVE